MLKQEPILISRDVLKMAEDWKRIKGLARLMPKEVSDACDRAVRDAMAESDADFEARHHSIRGGGKS